MVNFKIIDGKYDNFDVIDEFLELYNNPEYNVFMIREYFNITMGEYKRIRKHCIEKGLINTGMRKNTRRIRFSDYIRRNGRKYQIHKIINKKEVIFGEYISFDIAKKIVKELIDVNWDIDELPFICEKVLT